MDLANKRFIVSIDEIQQSFAFGEEFAGSYEKTVTLSDGTTRTVQLTPVVRDGQLMIELNDSGHRTYMGTDGTTTNGRLMVQVREIDTALQQQALRRPAPRVFPPETSLLEFPEFVPSGFRQGIEILNDDSTPMQFVTAVLGSNLGVDAANAERMMIDIHVSGGALLPTQSLAEAQKIAASITAEAAKHGYPLVCRAVGTPL